jgi:DNA ligase 1
MKEIMDIFKKIKNISGSNDKQAILRQNKENEEFVRLLTFLYNPYIITGIGKKKMKKFETEHFTYVHGFSSFFDVIDFVVRKKGSISDETVKTVANYINCQKLEVQGFLREVITKEFKCGITSSTINKVFGKNFIPKHDIMLAKSWGDEEHKIKGNFIVTEKLDGIRCTVIKENGETSFYTRKGLPILGLLDLKQEFGGLPDNTVYDGELLMVNVDELDSKTLFRKTQQKVRKDGNKTDIEFHMYDMLPLDEFKEGKSKLGAFDRKEGVYNLVRNLGFSFIKNVPILYFGSDKTEVMRLLKEAVEQGQEGVMVSPVHSKYECKRSSNLLKVKEMKTVDLRIIGFEEGEGKFVGTLGRLNVDYNGSSLGVGSGFTDNERDYIWSNRNKMVGRIAEIQYFEESENQNGGESLRFPVFVRFRDDKDEVSYHV